MNTLTNEDLAKIFGNRAASIIEDDVVPAQTAAQLIEDSYIRGYDDGSALTHHMMQAKRKVSSSKDAFEVLTIAKVMRHILEVFYGHPQPLTASFIASECIHNLSLEDIEVKICMLHEFNQLIFDVLESMVELSPIGCNGEKFLKGVCKVQHPRYGEEYTLWSKTSAQLVWEASQAAQGY